jgi:hypothetical protein
LKRIERERERIWLGVRGKREEQGGFGKNSIFFPPSRFGNREDRRGGGNRFWRGGAPAALAAAAAGDWGKMERGPRRFHPRAHLGLGLLREAAPRRGSGGGGR